MVGSIRRGVIQTAGMGLGLSLVVGLLFSLPDLTLLNFAVLAVYAVASFYVAVVLLRRRLLH